MLEVVVAELEPLETRLDAAEGVLLDRGNLVRVKVERVDRRQLAEHKVVQLFQKISCKIEHIEVFDLSQEAKVFGAQGFDLIFVQLQAL